MDHCMGCSASLGGNGDLIIPIFFFEKMMLVCWGLDLLEYISKLTIMCKYVTLPERLQPSLP